MTNPDPWTCPICGTRYPVRSLVTDCVNRHERETAP